MEEIFQCPSKPPARSTEQLFEITMQQRLNLMY